MSYEQLKARLAAHAASGWNIGAEALDAIYKLEARLEQAQAAQNAAGQEGDDKQGGLSPNDRPAPAAPVADSQVPGSAIGKQSTSENGAPAESASVVVPREPTEAMLEAAFNAPVRGHPETGAQNYRDIYRAMLAAAPASGPSERAAELGIHDDYWHSVALSLGEKLCATGPKGYYKFTPREWHEWCAREILCWKGSK